MKGNIVIKQVNNVVYLDGVCYANQKEYEDWLDSVKKQYEGYMIFNSIRLNEELIIHREECSVKMDGIEQDPTMLDEISILYLGMMDNSYLKENPKYKIVHPNNKLKIDNVVKVFRVITPIILDSDLNVIDGNLRLQLARENGVKHVPVIVYDCNGAKADALRLLLNRSNELQRWTFSEIDPFVDNHIQLQPLMEPLGFFGTNILPVSFFSNTVVGYEINPFDKKQQSYRQELGLAEWATIRRKQMEEGLKEKYAKKPPKKVKEKSTMTSLFDLVPTEEDFLPTYDVEQEREQLRDKWENKAQEYTKLSDKKIKERLEKEGKVWQNKVTSTNEDKAIERKKAFLSMLEQSDLTQTEKALVKEDLVTYANLSINEIKEAIRNVDE